MEYNRGRQATPEAEGGRRREGEGEDTFSKLSLNPCKTEAVRLRTNQRTAQWPIPFPDKGFSLMMSFTKYKCQCP